MPAVSTPFTSTGLRRSGELPALARRIASAARGTGRSLLGLARFLRAARRARITRIWTVHNLAPHEGAYRWDHYGYRLLARETDLIICHSEWSAALVRQNFVPAASFSSCPMANLRAHVRRPKPRRCDPRARAGSEAPLVSCLGRLRDYKGLELAAEAVERINGPVQLVIGGVRQTGFDLAPLTEAARRRRGSSCCRAG